MARKAAAARLQSQQGSAGFCISNRIPKPGKRKIESHAREGFFDDCSHIGETKLERSTLPQKLTLDARQRLP
jgi:hypothetical protein